MTTTTLRYSNPTALANIPPHTLAEMMKHGFDGINCSVIVALYLSNPETAEKFFSSDRGRVVAVRDPDPDLANTDARYHLLFELDIHDGETRYYDPKSVVSDVTSYTFSPIKTVDLPEALEAIFDSTLEGRVKAAASEQGLTFDQATYDRSIAAMKDQIRSHKQQPTYRTEPLQNQHGALPTI